MRSQIASSTATKPSTASSAATSARWGSLRRMETITRISASRPST